MLNWGLGYFEYFQFCEDIGAKPIPVVPARLNLIDSQAVKIILMGELMTENIFEVPEKIVPQTTNIKISTSFAYSTPGNSLTVIKFNEK